MRTNQIFELSMSLDNDQFQKVLAKVYDGTEAWVETGNGYIDHSLSGKGITAIYRNSQYKKKLRLIVNTYLLLDDVSDTDKLLRKLEKRIGEYFSFKFQLNDFALSGMSAITDIDVKNRDNASAYLKILQRVGKVKGFSPASYDGLNDKASFCLSGNSNAIDFLLYDLEQAVINQLRDSGLNHQKLKATTRNAHGILRAEVKLTKPKAVRVYTDATDTTTQITELSRKCQDVFLDTFIRIVPFGDFYKKDKAVEIIWQEVKDSIMRRKMLRLLALIPEKKSLHLAQKTMDCRNIEKVMDAFSKINLSPVTISKRHDVKKLENLYSYLM